MGYIPYIAAINPFLTMRSYEQIRDDLGYAGMNVKLIGSGSGLAYSILGASHETLEDVAVMRTVPNLTILAPGDGFEVQKCIKIAAEIEGPVYIRMPRQKLPDYAQDEKRQFAIGKIELLQAGSVIALIASGPLVREAIIAGEILEKHGRHITIANACCLKPFDESGLQSIAKTHRIIFSLEEHSVNGGLGTSCAMALAPMAISCPLHILGIPENGVLTTGPYYEVLEYYGLTGTKVAEQILNYINQERIN
jgi:transketolase